MSRGSKRHTHKYYHADLIFGKLWACALPDCAHHMPKHYEGMLIGKNSICWNCDDVFRLNQENMKDSKPICEKCRIGFTENDNENDDFLSLVKKISKEN